MNISKTSLPSSADDVVGRIADTTQGVVNQAAAKAGPAIETLRSTAESAVDTLAAKAAGLQKMERRMLLSAADEIRAHPFASIGIALAAGWLVAKLRH